MGHHCRASRMGFGLEELRRGPSTAPAQSRRTSLRMTDLLIRRNNLAGSRLLLVRSQGAGGGGPSGGGGGPMSQRRDMGHPVVVRVVKGIVWAGFGVAFVG